MPQSASAAELLVRALRAADVNNVRQLRQAVAAPYVVGAQLCDDGSSLAPGVHCDYEGGPCLLNASLVSKGHLPLPTAVLEQLMAETGGREVETPGAGAAGVALLAAVLAAHRATKAAMAVQSRTGASCSGQELKSPEGDTQGGAAAAAAAVAAVEEEHIRGVFAAASIGSVSQIRRMALFGQLASATGLTSQECRVAGEVSSVRMETPCCLRRHQPQLQQPHCPTLAGERGVPQTPNPKPLTINAKP